MPGQGHLDAIAARRFRQNPQQPVFQAPAVFTLSQWARERSSRADLLSGRGAAYSPGVAELRNLWVAAIQRSYQHIAPEESYALAGQCVAADRLISQWAGPGTGTGSSSAGADFKRWQASVNSTLAQRNWFAASDWINHFVTQIESGNLVEGILPKKALLHGFVELTRLENRLVEALRGCGVEVESQAIQKCRQNSCERAGYSDFQEELTAAARWAGRKLADGHNNIAIVVNELDAHAASTRRVLENIFNAQAILGFGASADNCFAAPSGTPLAAHPLIADALLLIKLALGGRYRQHEFADISRLLLSPAWSHSSEERFARARLEVRLREKGYFRCSLPLLIDTLSRLENPGELKQLRDCTLAITGAASEPDPVRQLLEWLKLWGWPGTAAQDQRSQDCYQRFLSMLERLSRESFADTASCFRQLSRACNEEEIPASGGAFSPIQVLSPEQAYGRTFDAAWVANLTLENWPPRPVSNPFLNSSVVRQIPRATEDGMLAYAQKLTGHLLGCAPDIRWSWCNRVNDLPVSASPLIEAIPEGEGGKLTGAALWNDLYPEAASQKGFRNHPWLEALPYEEGPPVSTGENPQLRSAVSVLNFQSACPLAAFLVFRLQARMEAIPGPFTDASFRGVLIHSALEELYREHKGGRDLPGPDEVAPAVQHALDRQHAEQRVLPAVLAAERRLLESALEDWLQYEQSISPGEIIGREWRTTLQLDGFNIEVQVDRIDRAEDGKVILIDYKTGSGASVAGWGEERIRDIQLPLYAVLLKNAGEMNPAGIAFARVRLHDTKIQGIGDEFSRLNYGLYGFDVRPGKLAKQLVSWDSALDSWSAGISGLLDEYARGDSRHQLFDDTSLKYAGLKGLLRSAEANRWILERLQ